MSREIKFRAWDKVNKRFHMWGVDLLGAGTFTGSPNPIFINQQYTGLKDKNGKEIYENDIVYIAGYGDYLCEYPFFELFDAVSENDIGEIKGNIYENGDLLNDK